MLAGHLVFKHMTNQTVGNDLTNGDRRPADGLHTRERLDWRSECVVGMTCQPAANKGSCLQLDR